MQRRGRNVLVLALAAPLALRAGQEFPAQPGEQVIPNQLIVKLRPNGILATLLSTYLPSAVFRHIGGSLYELTMQGAVPSGTSTRMAADASVDFVEPNRIRHSIGTPNDPYFSQQWALQTVGAMQTWNRLPGRFLTSSVPQAGRLKVAVLDTGA